MNYQLQINIDSEGLNRIYAAGQYVTLVKSVVADTLSSSTVAWVTFQPLQSNLVSWVENYSLYATTSTMQSGAHIVMTSTSQGSVQTGWLYTFQSGSFTGTSGSGNTFNINNQMSNYAYQFGLAQNATVNNVTTFAPLNAVPVLYNQSASFTPQEIISIFLSSYQNNGTVISSVAGNALTVTLSSTAPTATIGFNDSNNTFYQVAQTPLTAHYLARRLASLA